MPLCIYSKPHNVEFTFHSSQFLFAFFLALQARYCFTDLDPSVFLKILHGIRAQGFVNQCTSNLFAGSED